MAGVSTIRHEEAAAALGWWLAAGVDTIVDETPFRWLAPATPVVPLRAAAATEVPVATRAAKTTTAALNVDSLAALAAALAEAHPGALFADGTPGDAMVVGERPSAADLAAGRPFADAAGALLDRMLAAIQRSRADTYLANAVPWGETGRDADALPFLRRQVVLARPKAVLAMGQVATAALTGATAGIARLRGRWLDCDGVPVMPTFAPAHLLRQPGHKALAWADLCAFRARLAA
ncbi:MAG: uracil-DNA glycosylase [Sphingomonadaceae bacterium]|nr:uracil-DNA glycosylase [Sphingomonadaceae bacterium]